jgi:hypothetical protein
MANLSNIITQTVGNSSGGVNLITAPSQSSIWTATGLTLSTTTTASELPLEGFSSSAVKFLLTGSTTSAYVDFLVPTALAQTKLGLQWYARANVTTIGSITLSLSSYASAGNRTSNTSPTTVTLQTSSVASAATSFNTTFDTANQQYYRLTLNFPASASNWYTLAQFVLGPGVITQGAAVGEWQSITFAVPTNLGAGSGTNAAFFRRVGSNMDLKLIFTKDGTPGSGAGSVTFTMPTGYTINTGVLNAGVMGYAALAGSTYGPATNVFAVNSTTFCIRENGAATNLTGADFTAGSDIHLQLSIPIAEWAGNGTVNLGAGAQVEYAATSGTWDAASTTTVYGPGGQAIGGALTTGRVKTVTWQYPIQVGDRVEVEASRDGLTWAPINSFTFAVGQVIPALDSAAAAASGVTFYNSSSTQTAVVFNRYVNLANDDAPITDWPSSAAYWRVRKSTASSPVGFGLAGTDGSSGLYKAGQAPGLVTGATVSAGYIGEAFGTLSAGTGGQAYQTTTTTASTTSSAVDLVTLTLNKGVYLLFSAVKMTAPAGSAVNLFCSTRIGGTQVGSGFNQQSIIASAETTITYPTYPIVITADNTVVSIRCFTGAGTATQQINMMSAIRIA